MSIDSILQSLGDLEQKSSEALSQIDSSEMLEKFRIEWLGKRVS
jgi:hypothetical protein